MASSSDTTASEDDPPFLQVVVDSRGRWAVKSGSNAPYNQVAAGNVSNLKLQAGQQNHVMVVALEDRGWLFVNQTFIASFDLSDVKVSGDVAIITGAYSGGERAGASTEYENFRGYDLRRRYGPTSGTIERGEGFMGTHRSGFRSRDFVAEAEFSNPAGGQWDYGFLFRNPTSGHLEAVAVGNRGWWSHHTRSVGDSEYTELGSGRLSNWHDGPARPKPTAAHRHGRHRLVLRQRATGSDLDTRLQPGIRRHFRHGRLLQHQQPRRRPSKTSPSGRPDIRPFPKRPIPCYHPSMNIPSHRAANLPSGPTPAFPQSVIRFHQKK